MFRKSSTPEWTVKSKPAKLFLMTQPPATEKGRATRERILQAAAELVAEKGAAGMSLDDVRARTGASRSQLYHYFDDRDDLVRATLRRSGAPYRLPAGELSRSTMVTTGGMTKRLDRLEAR